MNGIMKLQLLLIKTYVIIIAILSSVGLSGCFENCIASGTTIYVDDDNTGGPWDGTPSHPYQYIRDGIDASTDGDTIYVYSGEYNEYLDVCKSITLQGHSKYNTIVTGNGRFTSDYVTLKEFTFGTEDAYRVLFVYANNTNIIGNNINGFITIDGSISNTNYRDNVIDENTILSGYINLKSCSDTTITNNNMATNAEESFQPIVVQNCSGGIVISGNNLEDVDYGISISGTNSATIEYNKIKIVYNYGLGIKLSSSSNCIISENIIQGIPQYGYGVKISDSSNNNQIYENTFIAECKAYDCAYDACNNFWYNPSTHRGNYWYNYRGKDSNHDSIGDTPYNISGGDNKDMYPLGYFNNPPDAPLNPYPPDGATNVEITLGGVRLKIDVSDSDDDCLIVCFYDASDDSLIGDGGCYYAFSGDAFNGESSSAPWYGVKHNTTYSWYVVVRDGCAICGKYGATTYEEGEGLKTTSDIFSFTTQLEPQENKRPIADAGGPYFGYVNAPIAFNGSGSTDPDGTITMYTWDFGDGADSGHGISPTHNYSVIGNYTVYLAVKDDDGWVGTNTTIVSITEPEEDIYPVADANGPYSGYVNTSITFDASNSYDLNGFIVSYKWHFGDGNTGTSISPTHTYTKAGNYTVILVVTDNQSLTDINTAAVTILKEKPIDTPGFELILVIMSITFILLWLLWTRKRTN